MVSFIRNLLGDTPEKRAARVARQVVAPVARLERSVSALTDAGIRDAGRRLRDEYRRDCRPQPRGGAGKDMEQADARALDRLLPESFALCREAARRALGQRHYDVQIAGGACLHRGMIAEMRTGEGKTLVATLPASLYALSGLGAHIITVNDYLARRDAVWMGPVYDRLGLTVACLQHEAAFRYDPAGGDLTATTRREAYGADILYGTNSEFGFDYLRSNTAPAPEAQAQGDCRHFAIIDEVDNILIDEARTPLIISGPASQPEEHYRNFAQWASRLREGRDYYINRERGEAAIFTEEGIERMERWCGAGDLYAAENTHLVRYLENALTARALKQRDKDYVVQDGGVVIVDEFTGRLQPGRRWSDGLHQAVEAKEGLKVQRESVTYATVTIQNYFRMYGKLAGMTGTAATEAEELYRIYGLEVASVPTNRPLIRKDQPDLLYRSAEAKWRAVVAEVAACRERGQPALVGTASVEASEELSERLRRAGIPHQALNARNHEREAGIIAQAGRIGAVTVATNMAGRGTDIILGGAPTDDEDDDAPEARARERERVLALGGLRVIGTERHQARRVDNQLRGRAGRQGDPGSSRFYLSMADDLLKLANSKQIERLLKLLGLDDDNPIESRMYERGLNEVQSRLEAQHFDARRHLLDYDDELDEQRRMVYAQRNRLLRDQEAARELALELTAAELKDAALRCLPTPLVSYDWDIPGLLAGWRRIAGPAAPPPELAAAANALDEDDSGAGRARAAEALPANRDEVAALLAGATDRLYSEAAGRLDADVMDRLAQHLLLNLMDRRWMEHLTRMENLRSGANLRSIGQRNPLQEYRRDGKQAFQEMRALFQSDVARTLFATTSAAAAAEAMRTQSPMHAVYAGLATAGGGAPVTAGGSGGRRQERRRQAVGRNSPCPCGSGRKYKRCCARGGAAATATTPIIPAA